LLVACAPERADEICAAIRAEGYPLARIIGKASAGEPVVRIT
jgi:selenide, water dikinase